MRIWSIHPEYLDTKGLVALWRESLLAKNVLEGRTKGYRNHPQLERFKGSENALACIHVYLEEVFSEAVKRGFNFDKSKFSSGHTICCIDVSDAQLKYEFLHLLKKLKERDINKYNMLKYYEIIKPHPLFNVIEGRIESWERF